MHREVKYFYLLFVLNQTMTLTIRIQQHDYRKLSLPAASECSIDLHEALVLVAARLCQGQFSHIQRSLTIEYFEIGR
jgi:hypothetical protein